MKKAFKTAILSLTINIVYGVYNIIVGITMPSGWFFSAGIYYLLLSVVHFFALRTKKERSEKLLKPFAGIMLMILSVPLAGMVILVSLKDRGSDFHENLMITIALYTFTKLTMAIINLVKAKGNQSVKIKVLRSISFADAFVSIFSLQRSMLVSFSGMAPSEIRIMNIVTGSAVSVLVFLIGLNLVYKKRLKRNKK